MVVIKGKIEIGRYEGRREEESKIMCSNIFTIISLLTAYVKWHDIDINGYHVITFSHGVTVNLSTLLGGRPFNGPLSGMKYPTRTKSTTRRCVPY